MSRTIRALIVNQHTLEYPWVLQNCRLSRQIVRGVILWLEVALIFDI